MSRTRVSFMSFSADGGIHILDVGAGMMIGQPGTATDILKSEGVLTGDQLARYLHGEEGARSMASRLMHYDAGAKEALMPKPEDLVAVPFRMLSAAIVGGGSWKATDFSDEAVLKKSVRMLDRRPVYTDHNTSVENWVGITANPVWQERQRNTKAGIVVPPGINATLLIDAKTRPEIARGVLLGALISNSVTVQFEWTPSHTFERDYEFNENMGKTRDGSMVRRIVNKIVGYHETSLVWLGADPFAKLLDDDGNLVDVDKAHVSYDAVSSADKKLYEEGNRYQITRSFEADVVRLAKLNASNPNPKPAEDMKPEVVAAILALVGIATAEAVTVEDVKKLGKVDAKQAEDAQRFAKLASLSSTLGTASVAEVERFATDHKVVTATRLTELEAAVAERDTLKAGAATLAAVTKERDDLKESASFGAEVLAARRKQVSDLYRKSNPTAAPDEAIVNLIAKADGKELSALMKQYGGQAAEAYGATCTKCGNGDSVQFRSSHEQGEMDKKTTTGLSAEDRIRASKRVSFGGR